MHDDDQTYHDLDDLNAKQNIAVVDSCQQILEVPSDLYNPQQPEKSCHPSQPQHAQSGGPRAVFEAAVTDHKESNPLRNDDDDVQRQPCFSIDLGYPFGMHLQPAVRNDPRHEGGADIARPEGKETQVKNRKHHPVRQFESMQRDYHQIVEEHKRAAAVPNKAPPGVWMHRTSVQTRIHQAMRYMPLSMKLDRRMWGTGW
eukprot:gnl/TRDRNA2_/TRDRNA2_145162_c2_seq1.p2 gnl/TRDRNA2_/TRDRNA2_145162_c2~~gnl/TRDRNA2_/TRDRNA2_145162_c2_seq1.p2  ORF type:complete len:212 (+),score=11.92 gnl/TRDRNA2_/TRDRNA2_145162_c2_seq1:39-638(+)